MPITDVGALAASTAAGVSSKLPAMAASGESSPATLQKNFWFEPGFIPDLITPGSNHGQ